MDKLLSIVIPLYNAEKYIKETLCSVLKQTFTNSEILIIDDGSTDNSVNIVKSLQKNYDRIKLIQQENSGASAARNRGIREANGKYIIMMDADDTIEDTMHETMVSKAEELNADMVVCNFATVLNNGQKRIVHKFDYPCDVLLDRKYIEKEVIVHSLYNINSKKFLNSHCTMMIKRSILAENKLEYDESKKKEEDKPFLMTCLNYIQKMVFVDGVFYNYIKRPGSLISQYSDRFNNILDNFDLYEKLFSNIYNFKSDVWLKYFVSQYEECISFVFMHKRNVQNVKKEIIKIITHPKSKEKFCLIENGYEVIKELYSKNNYNGIYRYYKKKFFKLRVKIYIRDFLTLFKIKI